MLSLLSESHKRLNAGRILLILLNGSPSIEPGGKQINKHLFEFLKLLRTEKNGYSLTQTSYLSLISLILLVEKKLPCGEFSAFCVWRLQGNKKIQMSSHDICGKIWNSKHLVCVGCKKRRHICKIYDIFLKKSVLSKFTHFVAKSVLS